MRPVACINLLVAPIIAIIMYFYFRKRNESGYPRLLIYSFFTGAAGVLALVAAGLIAGTMGLNLLVSLKRIVFYSFITIGGSCELGKFIVLRFFIIGKQAVRKPIDAINFSIMVALGFSTAALILFACNFLGARSAFPSTLYSSIFVPAGILFSVILGFFVGMAKFMKAPIVFSLTGLLGAACFHGIFNFCLLTGDYKLLSLFSFGSTVLVLVLGLKAANTAIEPSN